MQSSLLSPYHVASPVGGDDGWWPSAMPTLLDQYPYPCDCTINTIILSSIRGGDTFWFRVERGVGGGYEVLLRGIFVGGSI